MYELYLHGCYPRTATTFLQEKIFINLKNFDCLGKPHESFYKNGLLGDRGAPFIHNKELVELQNKIFPRKYSLRKEFPHNLSTYEKKYFNCLLKSITNSKNKKFILSDETLFDKINYFGDSNLLFLANIVNALKEKIEIKVKLILTIRKQSDLLPAIYSFDHYRQKINFHSLENFVSRFLDSENDEYGEIFNFNDIYNRLKKLFNSDILVLPLEELEKSPNQYVKKINSFLNTEFVLEEKENIPLKKNSYKLENRKVFFKRENTYQVLYNFLSEIHKFLLKYAIYKKFYKDSILLIKFKKFIRRQMKNKRIGELGLNQSQQLKIKQYYEKSNKLLAQEIGIDLKSLDYF